MYSLKDNANAQSQRDFSVCGGKGTQKTAGLGIYFQCLDWSDKDFVYLLLGLLLPAGTEVRRGVQEGLFHSCELSKESCYWFLGSLAAWSCK